MRMQCKWAGAVKRRTCRILSVVPAVISQEELKHLIACSCTKSFKDTFLGRTAHDKITCDHHRGDLRAQSALPEYCISWSKFTKTNSSCLSRSAQLPVLPWPGWKQISLFTRAGHMCSQVCVCVHLLHIHLGVSPWQPIPLMWVGPGVQPPACLPLICHRNTLNIGCFKSLKLFKALCSVLLIWLSYFHFAFLISSLWQSLFLECIILVENVCCCCGSDFWFSGSKREGFFSENSITSLVSVV